MLADHDPQNQKGQNSKTNASPVQALLLKRQQTQQSSQFNSQRRQSPNGHYGSLWSRQHGRGQGEQGRGDGGCQGAAGGEGSGRGVFVRRRRGRGASGAAAAGGGLGGRRHGRGSRGGGDDADVHLLAAGAVARDAAEEVVVAGGVEDDGVVARVPGGHRLAGVAVLVGRLAHRHHVVELLVVREHCTIVTQVTRSSAAAGIC